MNSSDLNYKQGAQLALENAKKLFESAELIAEKENYGLAISLLVLSAEEAAKAMSTFMQGLHPDGKTDDFEKVFNDHKYKLANIREAVLFSRVFKNASNLLYAEIFKDIENESVTDDEMASMKSEGVKKVEDYFKSIIGSKETDLSRDGDWWRGAKSLKEDGFYVRVNNHKWHTPRNMEKPSYLKTKNYVVEFLQMAFTITHIPFDEEPIKSMLNKVTEGMKQRDNKTMIGEILVENLLSPRNAQAYIRNKFLKESE